MIISSAKLYKKTKFIILGFLFLIGIVISLYGNYLVIKAPDNLYFITLQGFGFTLVTAGIVSLITDYFLMNSISSKTEEVFENIIDSKIPNNFKKFKKAGISDTYKNLNTDKILDKLQNAENCDIYIFKIWISDVIRMNPILKDAVERRGCKVKILLLDPTELVTINKRASTLEIETPSWIRIQIEQNIEIIENLKLSIKPKFRKNFKFKTHKSFVSVSIFGIGSQLSLGLYLRDCLSSNSFQIELTNETNSYFNTIKEHFDKEWKQAKEYNFINSNETFNLDQIDDNGAMLDLNKMDNLENL